MNTNEMGTLKYTRDVRRVTIWGLVINLALAAVKFVFGYFGRSQALIADAVHSLSDTSTDIAVLVGVGYWSAPADVDHPYGHSRIEALVSLFIGVMLGAVGLGLAYRAVATLQTPHWGVPGLSAFATACASIVVKEVLYRWTVAVSTRTKSSALAANAWHHRSDALSSVPVAVAALGAQIRPAWGLLDHVAAVIVSVLILRAAWHIARPALGQLLDTGADEAERQAIRELALGTDGIRGVHALRTRRIGSGLQIDIHIQVDPHLSVREGHAIAGATKKRLLVQGPSVIDALIHLEPFES